MERRVLVTGITGFIGSSLARRLIKENWRVHAIVRSYSNVDDLKDISNKCDFHIYDGTTESLIKILESSKPEVVFHLASLFLSNHKPNQINELISSNVLFSTQLVEAMVQTNCKQLVNTGSSWQHYNTTQYCPVNLYAATKEAFESLLKYYHDAYDLSCITLKLFDTYGPNDKRRKLINILLEAAESGDLLDMSPGEQIVDLTHVDDVSRAFIRSLSVLESTTKPLFEQFFVSGERVSIQQLVRLVEKELNVTLHINFGGRPYRNREVMVPVFKENNTLPCWHPEISIKKYLSSIFGK